MHVNSKGSAGFGPDRRVRAVVYARYSTDLQREASIADQVELCRRYCLQQGFDVVAVFDDAAQSGSNTALRPGFQRMVLAAETGAFDVVVVEAVDRLSRRLADVAFLHDRLAFRGVAIHAPSLGGLTAMHVGIMGTVAQMQLVDLGQKTKRGQAGRVRAGRIPAGLAYGYEVVPPAPGSKEAGERRIVPAEADVVRRIFQDYAAGIAPRQIARKLNEEGIGGPGGRPWLDTTIRGQPERGTGILNNTLYNGELVWNRVSYVKDPTTGKREARLNPTDQREHKAVLELRIVDAALWQRVQQQRVERSLPPALEAASSTLNQTHRRKFVLSGLLKCAACGGAYTVVAKDRYGCAMHVKSGTCANGATIRRAALERRVLDALRDKMLAPDLMAAFIVSCNAEVEAARVAELRLRAREAAELVEVDRKIRGIVDAIENGAWSPALQDRLAALENRKVAIIAAAKNVAAPSNVVEIRPATADTYRSRVADLLAALSDSEAQTEAAEALRTLIEKIVLTPDKAAPDLHHIDLYGDLAAALAMTRDLSGRGASNDKTAGSVACRLSQVSVVAGTGFEPVTFRL